MGRWLAKIQKSPISTPTKLTEPSYVGFVGSPQVQIEKNNALFEELEVARNKGPLSINPLDALHQEEESNSPNVESNGGVAAGRWLKKIQTSPISTPTKPTELGYVSFVGSLLDQIEKNNAACEEFEITRNKAPPPINPLDALRQDEEIDFLYDDFTYLSSLLIGTSLKERRKLLVEYKQQWLTGMTEENLLVHQQQNRGRFVANNWIRQKVLAESAL